MPTGAILRRTTSPPDPCQDATYRALYLIDSQIPHEPERSEDL
ncbi:hypothetical protein [Arthrobacter terrae]|nr:hypothetical protein [Arthrobacter terrae]